MPTKPFRFGPLQIFFCVILLIVIIVIVTFNRKPSPTTTKYTLNIAYSGKGTGTVTTSPKSSTGTFDSGTKVTLTATPTNSSTFANWTGDLTGTADTIIMNSNKSVTAIFNPPTTTYAAVVLDDNVPVVSYFSSLSSNPSKIIKEPNHAPIVITQLLDKSIIVIEPPIKNNQILINTIDTNGTYTYKGILNISAPNILFPWSLQQINNGSFILVISTLKGDGSIGNIVYQSSSSSLTGSWVPLGNLPNYIRAVSQSKDGKTFYCITGDGLLYSSSNITDEFSKWTPISLKLANGSGYLNQISSFTPLNNGSFIAIDSNWGGLYQTTDPTLQTGWVLVNNNQQFISITEIIS
jgi:hypothetical protein